MSLEDMTITLAVIASIAIIAILFVWSQAKLNVEKIRASSEETRSTLQAKADITIAQIKVQNTELEVGVQEKIAGMQTNLEKEKAALSFEGGREERVIKRYEIETEANTRKYAVDSLLKETQIKVGAQLHEVNQTNEFRQRKLVAKETMHDSEIAFKKSLLESQTEFGNKMLDFQRHSVNTEASTRRYLGDKEMEKEALVQGGMTDRLMNEIGAKQKMFMRGIELEEEKLKTEERLTTAQLEFDTVKQEEETKRLQLEVENNPWNNLISTAGKLIEVGAISMSGPVGMVGAAAKGARAIRGAGNSYSARGAASSTRRSKNKNYDSGEFDLD